MHEGETVMNSCTRLANYNRRLLGISITALAFSAAPVWAQDADPVSPKERSGGAAAALSEEIVVTV
jgi:hypothetical protein